MRFLNLMISLAGLATSAAAFTINVPSTANYWVQFATNSIAWTNGPNDSPAVTLQIINANQTLLNGIFSITEYVPAALEQYTVTNVTLVVADGYIVQMVNPANSSQVYASSSPFSVKPSDTTPAPGSAGLGSPSTIPGANDMRKMTGMSGMPGNGTNGHPGNTTGFSNSPNGTASGNARSDATNVASISFAAMSLVASAIGFASL
ncbi:hypothetical protein MJO28_004336 [Puccinia striiformis f. sp. tritici]|uniref:Yeast cell wall synthesis Kre9/Knh1-like N-terminal domain-containing protein n=2 Tax=Puccinia striiformis f. sp. tritici TaxID=168172 RepID=A0A0L0VJK5_9BASI|nr:hypothetical protein Pst134EA_007073 [Puccinia striiformis f. sp. tritici]KAI9608616.1 hypothetical protein H4Q26_004801 [Puccinia striiformis f. sp. tritici PST-130]KNE99450.1 hypothetical protein PSTG_07375 [Puccinia striiformis f. sp. tritici PST-78]KAH9460009.1 hypothetical protein Pst134EB_008213 [Puccinia striiformis f. sp. tritici]KAH9469799.1 hypothetical protein Pst134EA_007073 [Puccinia striiformis f. sp. tritici]KAI7957241.1 hypothetical protein MJO28_004336 [Puccinia striiformis